MMFTFFRKLFTFFYKVNKQIINELNETISEEKNKIGEGSFSYIYKHILKNTIDNSQQEVAIKVFKSSLGSNAVNTKKSFNIEKTVLEEIAAFQSEHIIAYFGSLKLNAHRYLIIEYCALGSIKNYVEQYHAIWPIEDRYRLLQEIIPSIKFLHQNSFIHHDIKAENILVTAQFEIKLSDFGLTARIEGSEELLEKKGSPLWMAPEVCFEKSCTNKVDIYSFAMTAYEIVTNQDPFQQYGFNHLQHFLTHLGKGGRMDLPIDLKPKIAHLIKLCWAQDPNKRPSAPEIEEILSSDINDLTSLVRYYGFCHQN